MFGAVEDFCLVTLKYFIILFMAVIMLCYLFCKICIYNFEKLLGENLVLWLRDSSTVRKHAASLSASIDLLQ